ncbi:hypothetical protein MTR_2g103610 [Medicago truncatula]|uniref:Uncharacterized protein n=1 Tax=Medicago truncatula TaxID=3880 RepID=G7IUV5_MEDTR|nr:hypothetical protein MTR_2g103610 [Medicago truncatula]
MQVREQKKSEYGRVAKQSQSHEAWLSERYAWLGELRRFWTSNADVAETQWGRNLSMAKQSERG